MAGKKITTGREKTYHELLTPFASKDDSEDAIKKFFKEVTELREKYKLPDVTVIAQYTVMHTDSVCEFYGITHMGNPANQLTMLAQALGRARGELDATLGHLRQPR